jgi:hypothetical protein
MLAYCKNMTSRYSLNSHDRNLQAYGSARVIWDDRWMRFRMALERRGLEPGCHDFYRGWVLALITFIRPKKFSEANQGDVEEFLQGRAAQEKGTLT